MIKRVYLLGNPIVENDGMPIYLRAHLQKELPGVRFTIMDPTEEFSQASISDFVLIDTVIGLNEVTTYTDLDNWMRSPRVTVHDFDLPVSLGLLKKLGKINSVTIIGVPEKGNRKGILRQVINQLKAI